MTEKVKEEVEPEIIDARKKMGVEKFTSAEEDILLTISQQQKEYERALELAKLSEDVYNDSGAPIGWKRWDFDDLAKELPDGLKEFELGFYAALYQSEKDSKNKVLAYRGSEMEMEDWETNFKLAFGKNASQYDQAKDLAKSVKDYCKKRRDKLEITGHSLGGGLATVASLATKTVCCTFNSVGIHQNTLEKWDENEEWKSKARDLIHAYRVDGEILTSIQESLKLKFLGVVFKSVIQSLKDLQLSRAMGGPYILSKLEDDEEKGSIKRHKMKEVILAIEDEIARNNECQNSHEKLIERVLEERDGSSAIRIIENYPEDALKLFSTSIKIRLVKNIGAGKWVSGEDAALKKLYKSCNPQTEGEVLKVAIDCAEESSFFGIELSASAEDRTRDIMEVLSDKEIRDLPQDTKDRMMEALENDKDDRDRLSKILGNVA